MKIKTVIRSGFTFSGESLVSVLGTEQFPSDIMCEQSLTKIRTK